MSFEFREYYSQVTCFKNCSIDDTVGEGPHASMGRQLHHARGAKWPYAASTSRLQQNIEDVSLHQALRQDLDNTWAQYKNVIKTERFGRGIKIPWQELCSKVYTTDHLKELRPDAVVRDCPSEASSGDDDDDASLPDEKPPDVDVKMTDEELMLRDYYLRSLPSHSFITVPCLEDGRQCLRVFQV